MSSDPYGILNFILILICEGLNFFYVHEMVILGRIYDQASTLPGPPVLRMLFTRSIGPKMQHGGIVHLQDLVVTEKHLCGGCLFRFIRFPVP